ncbi:MAG: ATP-binding cassette domain-containing protein, partial [Acetobacteraceae bacterium]
MAERVLEVAGLRAGYGPAEVLFGVDLNLARGEVAALMGRNGAGKSTTLKAIMGLLPPRGGSVRFAGAEIAGWAPFRIARLGLGYVPEERRIFTELTVAENLEVGRRGGGAGRTTRTPERLFSLLPNPTEKGHHHTS